MTALTNKEKQGKRRARLGDMMGELDAGISWETFSSRILKNWETRPKSDRANILLIKLVKELKG